MTLQQRPPEAVRQESGHRPSSSCLGPNMQKADGQEGEETTHPFLRQRQADQKSSGQQPRNKCRGPGTVEAPPHQPQRGQSKATAPELIRNEKVP